MPASESEGPKRILLVDDHALVRRGLAALIGTDPGLVVCGEADTRETGLKAVATLQPDLVIADLSLRDSDGLEMIKDIKRLHPGLPVLALTMHDEAIYAERALRAGARGYVAKQDMDDSVLNAVRRLLAGGIHTSEALGRKLTEKFIQGGTLGKGGGLERLSDRELEVFKQIGRGESTGGIARALGLSVKTIETHREHLKSKLDLSSGAALSRCAVLWTETGHLG